MDARNLSVPGHFALETHGEEIAARIEAFLKQHQPMP